MNDWQTTSELIYGGSFSSNVLIGAGIILAVLISLMAWRQAVAAPRGVVWLSTLLRLVVLCIALWMLAQPTIRTIHERLQRKSIALLADASASMLVADAAGPDGEPCKRLDEAINLLENAESLWLPTVEAKARVLRYQFSGEVEPVSAHRWPELETRTQSAGMSTDLAAALEQAIRDRASSSLQAVVLLSDGGHNRDSDPLAAASLSGVPVYVVSFGDPAPERDVVVHHAHAPRAVLQHDSIVIDATIDAQGCQGEELMVELLRGDERMSEQRVLVPTDNYSRRLTFARKAEQIGLEQLTVRAIPLPDELTPDNNQARLDVQVTEGKIPVLLVDRVSRWEFRFLRNLLRRDEQTELDYLLLTPLSGSDSSGAPIRFPSTLEQWERYRVLIVGDVSPDVLTTNRQQQLVEYVGRRGGTLVVIAGEHMPAAYQNTPLEPLLPVIVDDRATSAERIVGLVLTPGAADSPVTQFVDDPLANERIWRNQFSAPAGSLVLNPWSVAKPTAHVLVQAVTTATEGQADHTRAFLCWQQFGRGKVIYLSAPLTYLLRQRHGDEYHHRFWGQLLRWANAREMAGGSQAIQVATDRTRYYRGEDVQVIVRLRQADGTPVVLDGERVVARRGDDIVAEAALTPDPSSPGLYRAGLQGLPVGMLNIQPDGTGVRRLMVQEGITEPVTTSIVMEPPESLELRATRCNLPLLRRIADSTGGSLIAPSELAETVAAVDLTPEVSRSVSQRPLWDRWVYLWIVIGCLTFEWGLRKWVGLP